MEATMKMKTTTIALVLAALCAASAGAQPVANLAYAYDLDSDVFVYPVLKGRNEDPIAGARTGPSFIKTTGSSTSITEAVVGSNPFAAMAVGDVIRVSRGAGLAPDIRIVITYTDDSNIVVDTAINLDRTAGYAFTWWEGFYGTTAADGWVDLTIAFRYGGRIAVQYEQGDFVTGLQFVIECRTQGLDPKPVQVYPGDASDCGVGTLVTATCEIATAPARVEVVLLPEQAGVCRVGIRRNGVDTSDAGAAIERVSISATGVMSR